MARVYRKTRPDPKRPGQRLRARKWTAVYRDPAWPRHREEPGYTDKAATLALAQRLEREAAARFEGVAVPGDRARALADALDEYLAEKERGGITAKHVAECRARIRRAAAAAGWRRLDQISAAGLRTFLGGLRGRLRAEPSAATVNAYRDAVSAFCAWCVAQGYLPADPVAAVAKARERRERRPGRRRALAAAELAALCAAAPRGRGTVYALAAATGFRRRTLRLLERRHLDLAAPGRPAWRLTGDILKSGSAAAVPCAPEALALLHGLHPGLDALPPAARLLPRLPRDRTVAADLRRAGLDPAGPPRLNFHCLRYTFCAKWARVLPIQKVKALMTHATIAQTADLYGALGLEDVGDDVWTLPEGT
ncbi:MAG: hypothetical protein ACRC33_22590 [Gemmataceae bacterium]